MNKSDIHSFDKDLPTFSTEEPEFLIRKFDESLEYYRSTKDYC